MTTPKQYRKKPVTIEAMCLTGSTINCLDVRSWMEANGYPLLVGNALEPATLRLPNQDDDDTSAPDKGIWFNPSSGDLMIRTPGEGDLRARTGGWVVRNAEGEFYPCDPDTFDSIYEEVTE